MNKIVTAASLVLMTGAAMAEEATTPAVPPVTVGGEIETVLKENVAGNIGATTSFDLDLEAGVYPAFGGMSFVMDTDNDVTLDEWYMGTDLAVGQVTFGNQGNIFVEGESDYSSLEDPALGTSLQFSAGGAQVGVGFTDIEADVTDIENFQGAYTMDLAVLAVTASGDYNLDSEEWVAGGRVATVGMLDQADLGTTVTYGSASEAINYEVDATVLGTLVYVNGNDTDAFRNVGGEYTHDLAGLGVTAGVNYDIDAEEVSPSLAVSFAF